MNVTVVGMGYVGATIAAVAVKSKKHNVIGFDTKNAAHKKIRKKGEQFFKEGIQKTLYTGIFYGKTVPNYRASINPEESLRGAEIVFVAVGINITQYGRATSVAFDKAIDFIDSFAPKDAIVVISATVPPGTTKRVDEKLANPVFYVPERVTENFLMENYMLYPKDIGYTSDEDYSKLRKYFHELAIPINKITDAVTVEVSKTAENAYRDVMLAFANEIRDMCIFYGADPYIVRDIINQTGSKADDRKWDNPQRHMLLPGTGVGGYCIPKDSYLLANQYMESYQLSERKNRSMILSARGYNKGLPVMIMTEMCRSLRRASMVLLLGWAFKPNGTDGRNTPALTIYKYLLAASMEPWVYDPDAIDKEKFVRYVDEVDLERYHAIVLVTEHDWVEELFSEEAWKHLRLHRYILTGKDNDRE